jgi:alpha-tubulin suppressor-like RCC1 family protein
LIEDEITDVSAGSRHTFLIQADGTAVVAGFRESGAGYQGHLGLGVIPGRNLGDGKVRESIEPTVITTVVNADGKEVDAPQFQLAFAGVGVGSDSGAMHALLISQDGKAYLSGNNNKGQLCLGNVDPVDLFHEVKGIDNVVHGAVGSEFTLLVTASGQVYGCGSNEVGQLGEEPDVILTTTPTEIKGDLDGITEVEAGLAFALYLNSESGRTWGSGSNIYGQLCGFTEGTPIYLPEVRSTLIEYGLRLIPSTFVIAHVCF